MRSKLAWAIVGLMWVLTGPLHAETATAKFVVSANVIPSCTVSSDAISFGTYVPNTLASREGAMTVNCTAGTAYAITLDQGGAGDDASRRMVRSDGATLPYDLYRDGAHQQRWGSGANARAGTGSGAEETLTMYAAIPATAAPPGNYSDNITILVTY